METTTESVELVDGELIANLALAAVIPALMGATAAVSIPIPFSPVPITLQVLFVLLAGALLGAAWGAASMSLYLLAGILGAPVFAGYASGLGVVLSESGGYLLSYPIAAAVAGWIVYGSIRRTRLADVGPLRLLAGFLAAVLIVYALGVIGLMVVLSLGPFEAALAGVVPFVPGEAVKIGAAVVIVQATAVAVDAYGP